MPTLRYPFVNACRFMITRDEEASPRASSTVWGCLVRLLRDFPPLDPFLLVPMSEETTDDERVLQLWKQTFERHATSPIDPADLRDYVSRARGEHFFRMAQTLLRRRFSSAVTQLHATAQRQPADPYDGLGAQGTDEHTGSTRYVPDYREFRTLIAAELSQRRAPGATVDRILELWRSLAQAVFLAEHARRQQAHSRLRTTDLPQGVFVDLANTSDPLCFTVPKRALTEACGLVDAHRRIVITGPPKAGKSTLALHVGRSLCHTQHLPGWLVEPEHPSVIRQVAAVAATLPPACIVVDIPALAHPGVFDLIEPLAAACHRHYLVASVQDSVYSRCFKPHSLWSNCRLSLVGLSEFEMRMLLQRYAGVFIDLLGRELVEHLREHVQNIARHFQFPLDAYSFVRDGLRLVCERRCTLPEAVERSKVTSDEVARRVEEIPPTGRIALLTLTLQRASSLDEWVATTASLLRGFARGVPVPSSPREVYAELPALRWMASREHGYYRLHDVYREGVYRWLRTNREDAEKLLPTLLERFEEALDDAGTWATAHAIAAACHAGTAETLRQLTRQFRALPSVLRQWAESWAAATSSVEPRQPEVPSRIAALIACFVWWQYQKRTPRDAAMAVFEEVSRLLAEGHFEVAEALWEVAWQREEARIWTDLAGRTDAEVGCVANDLWIRGVASKPCASVTTPRVEFQGHFEILCSGTRCVLAPVITDRRGRPTYLGLPRPYGAIGPASKPGQPPCYIAFSTHHPVGRFGVASRARLCMVVSIQERKLTALHGIAMAKSDGRDLLWTIGLDGKVRMIIVEDDFTCSGYSCERRRFAPGRMVRTMEKLLSMPHARAGETWQPQEQVPNEHRWCMRRAALQVFTIPTGDSDEVWHPPDWPPCEHFQWMTEKGVTMSDVACVSDRWLVMTACMADAKDPELPLILSYTADVGRAYYAFDPLVPLEWKGKICV